MAHAHEQHGHQHHHHATAPPAVYGLLAQFDSPEDLMMAAEATHKAGYREFEAYSSFPIEGMVEATGRRRTRLPLIIFMCGLTGLALGYLLQWYTAGVDFPILNIGPYYIAGYPLNIGGRPLNSIPQWIPIMFEMTVLLAGFGAFFGTLILNGLPRPHHPIFNAKSFDLASQDKFFLCIEAEDPRYDRVGTLAFMNDLHPELIEEVPND